MTTNHGRTEGRAHTDAGLVAERAGADDGAARSTALGQRRRDAVIERDRMMADQRLLGLRTEADERLALDRSVGPTPTPAISRERHRADDDKGAERHATDAVADLRREGAEAALDSERHAHAVDSERQVARREHTDRLLSTERSGADHTLDDANAAVARARDEQVRRNNAMAAVTHDLRSPLCVISLNAQSIVAETAEPATREMATDMLLAVARMERLLTDLLDDVRASSGVWRMDIAQADASRLARDVLNIYKPLFVARQITLTADIPSEPVVALFDRDRIVQVLSNLLGNTMKFVLPGGAVEIGVASQGGYAEFEVRDTGVGISPTALPQVFDRFWQHESTDRRGLGLGLFICQQIVRAHGGEISVASEVGRGTTFRFTLPAG